MTARVLHKNDQTRRLKIFAATLAGSGLIALIGLLVVYAPLYSTFGAWMTNGISHNIMNEFAVTCEVGDADRITDVAAGVKQSEMYYCAYAGLSDNWSGAVYYPYGDFEQGKELPERLQGFFGINKCLSIKSDWLWCYAT